MLILKRRLPVQVSHRWKRFSSSEFAMAPVRLKTRLRSPSRYAAKREAGSSVRPRLAYRRAVNTIEKQRARAAPIATVEPMPRRTGMSERARTPKPITVQRLARATEARVRL